MSSENALLELLGPARHQTYMDAAAGTPQRAAELYEWSNKLAGAWHSHIAYVEVAVRNAIDRQLRTWNASQVRPDGTSYSGDWTRANGTAEEIYTIIGRSISEAHASAANEARRRPESHPRHDTSPTHDDVVAQMTFGLWTRLVLHPPEFSGSGPGRTGVKQRDLWRKCLYLAFPGAPKGDTGRIKTGRQLEGIRRIRNRIAHHDNLLKIDTTARLNGSLTLLRYINPSFPNLVMAHNTLRRLVKEDPRIHW
jgi:hypothetical protein